MIKQLRKRPRVDELRNDVRSATDRPRHRGRLIYLGLLGLFFAILLDHFMGSFVFLRADGMVLQKRHVIAALYPARVAEIFVREGQQIAKGAPVVRIESTQILRQLAELSARNAELVAKVSQLKSRVSATRALLPMARQHADQARTAVSGVERLKSKSLATMERMGQAYRSRLDTLSRLAELEAESRTLARELVLVEAAQADAQKALERLKGFYNNGLIAAQVSGTIGPRLPSLGDVKNIGEDIVTIYSGSSFLFAYLSDNYLFSVQPGDRVRVAAGSHHATGVVREVLPVADALPKEFQNIFKPRERSRLLRIDLAPDHPFAVSQKVSVRRQYFALEGPLFSQAGAERIRAYVHAVLRQVRCLPRGCDGDGQERRQAGAGTGTGEVKRQKAGGGAGPHAEDKRAGNENEKGPLLPFKAAGRHALHRPRAHCAGRAAVALGTGHGGVGPRPRPV